MEGTGFIDNFLEIFTRYIDSGFGLLQGDVRWLASILIAIDVTLAGLFWAMGPDENVLARLIKKTTNSGVFIRCEDPQRPSAQSCYEVQINDSSPNRDNATGAIVNAANGARRP